MQLKRTLLLTLFPITCLVSQSVFAQKLSLSSNDIEHNQYMAKQHEFNGFGCTGDDQSPHLKWSHPPEGTKSFAITVYDPDAPTGSGWWHWQVVNIPLNTTELKTNAGTHNSKLMPENSQTITNDYGIAAFGGACPPKGHQAHRYQFTIHALSVNKLELPENASGALAGYMIQAHSIESRTLEALYQRE